MCLPRIYPSKKPLLTHFLSLVLTHSFGKMGRTSRAPTSNFPAYLYESVEHHVRVERVAALPRGLDDRVDVLVPEDAVGRVNLRDVAEQPLGVDLAQDRAALQVQQAVQEQLQWNIPSFRFPFPPGLTRKGRSPKKDIKSTGISRTPTTIQP